MKQESRKGNTNTTTMEPAKWDITIYKGVTFYKLRTLSKDNEPFPPVEDNDTLTWVAEIYNKDTEVQLIEMDLTVTDDGIKNIIAFLITSDDTEDLPESQSGTYRWRLRITRTSDDFVWEIWRGEVNIIGG